MTTSLQLSRFILLVLLSAVAVFPVSAVDLSPLGALEGDAFMSELDRIASDSEIVESIRNPISPRGIRDEILAQIVLARSDMPEVFEKMGPISQLDTTIDYVDFWEFYANKTKGRGGLWQWSLFCIFSSNDFIRKMNTRNLAQWCEDNHWPEIGLEAYRWTLKNSQYDETLVIQYVGRIRMALKSSLPEFDKARLATRLVYHMIHDEGLVGSANRGVRILEDAELFGDSATLLLLTELADMPSWSDLRTQVLAIKETIQERIGGP